MILKHVFVLTIRKFGNRVRKNDVVAGKYFESLHLCYWALLLIEVPLIREIRYKCT